MAGTIFSAVAAPLIGGAVSSLFGGGSSGNKGATAAAGAADPFSGQRPQYQQQLSDLMSNPGSFSMTPQAQFTQAQGEQAVTRQMASRGISDSGAEKIGLEQYATGFAGQQYQQQIQDLMTLSGANSGAPGTAGNIMAGQSTANSNALGTIGSTIGNAVTGTDAFQGMTAPGGIFGSTATDMTGFQTAGGNANAGAWTGSSAASGAGAGMTSLMGADWGASAGSGTFTF